LRRQLEIQQQREQAEHIKRHLYNSLAGETILQILSEMQDVLGVQLHVYSTEEPALRLGWTVTFNQDPPCTFCYFVVRRLFAGRELDPQTVYLGPHWTVPEEWLNCSEKELNLLFRDEEIEVRSNAGVKRIKWGSRNWTRSLRAALKVAYQHPYQNPHPGDRRTVLYMVDSAA
jgi:hypothetical protein